MLFRTENIAPKKFIGKRILMSLLENKNQEVWRSFMPRRFEIQERIGSGLYSVKFYPEDYFTHFSPGAQFEKWAVAEVSGFENIPEGMESIEISGGLYAVYHYKGRSSEGADFFRNIFTKWLPESDYELDHRPHIDHLGDAYKNNDPESEEDILIPVRQKK